MREFEQPKKKKRLKICYIKKRKRKRMCVYPRAANKTKKCYMI